MLMLIELPEVLLSLQTSQTNPERRIGTGCDKGSYFLSFLHILFLEKTEFYHLVSNLFFLESRKSIFQEKTFRSLAHVSNLPPYLKLMFGSSP